MIDKYKILQLKKLDQYIKETKVCDRPSDGWIRAIRKSLGMGVNQLACRMGVSQQAVSQLESKELQDSITIKTLRKAAEAMGCKVIYAIVPNNGSLEDLVRKQAIKKAKEVVYPVDQTMMLEAQRVGDTDIKIMELAEDLVRNPNHKLWE